MLIPILIDEKYQRAAEKAFVALTRPIAEGGVLFEDEAKNLWIEEYLVDPPTHILNGFMWALWGVFDFWLARGDASAKEIFDRGVRLWSTIWLASIPDTGRSMNNPELG